MKSRDSSTSLLIFVVGMAFAHEAHAQGNAETLAKLRASLDAVNQLSLSFERNTDDCENDVEEVGYRASKQVVDINHCGDLEKLTTYSIPKGEEESDFYISEYIVHPDGSVFAAQAMMEAGGKQKPAEERLTNLLLVWSDKQLVKEDVQVRDRQAVMLAMAECGVVLGLIGQSSLFDYLQEGDAASKLKVDGATLTSEGRLGKIELELSPDHGWLPRTFVVEKSAESMFAGRPVRMMFEPAKLLSYVVVPDGQLPAAPKFDVKRLSWHGKVSRFSQTDDGVWYPAELEVVGTMELSNGINKCISRISVKPIAQNGSASCALKIEIPVGYKVGIDGAPHLPYR